MKKAQDASKDLIEFLDKQQVINVKNYYKDALDERLGKFVPEDTRNFLDNCTFRSKPLYSHFFHWFELAEMDLNPHKNIIRKDAVLYNIFDSRNEGVATSVEEMFMQAGLYESNPRSKEIVYILIAQLPGSRFLVCTCKSNDNGRSGSEHSEYTPRGWMKTEKGVTNI